MQNEENNGIDVPVIDRSKCKRMLVWDGFEDKAEERIVLFHNGTYFYCVQAMSEVSFLNGGDFMIMEYTNAKPLPEPKPMSALDVLFWDNKMMSEGRCIVTKHKESEEFDNQIPEFDGIEADFSNYHFNELIRKDGKTVLFYDDWKLFNFDNCQMN